MGRDAERMAREKIGILGGTFNPVHSGHIAMARTCLTQLKLDRVLLLPDGVPPHKQGIASQQDRWRMLCAAVVGEEGLEPCRMELDRPGTTYTIDTLTRLHEQMPKAELYYIIGADTLMELHRWRFFERVLKLCTFLVVPRICAATPAELDAERRRLTAMGGSFISIDAQPVTVSSSALREAILQDAPTPLLPVTLREYCGITGIYTGTPRVPQVNDWMPRLFADLSRKRFSHTLAVAHTARSLALIHHVDPLKAQIAALLHDCAKCLPLRQMQRVALQGGAVTDPEVLESQNLLHSVAGAALARSAYGIEDPQILDAIAAHTTGHADMSPLAMVVYLADKIEPTRQDYPTLAKVRMLASLSLQRAMLCSLQGTAAHVAGKKAKLHPRTLQTLNWLKSKPAQA